MRGRYPRLKNDRKMKHKSLRILSIKLCQLQLAIVICILCGVKVLNAQDSGYYYKYTFDDFLTSKTLSEREYIKSIYKNLVYPKKERENGIEGIIRVLIINHDKDNTEILTLNEIQGLDDVVMGVITKTNEKYLLKSNEKYITELFVDFDFEPLSHDKRQDNIIRVPGFKTRQKEVDSVHAIEEKARE